MIKYICRDDPEAVSLMEQATATRPGPHAETFDNIKELPPTGTSAEYAHRRLRRSAPALHEKVLTGELSANAAMIEAGFRKRQITVPVEINRAHKPT